MNRKKGFSLIELLLVVAIGFSLFLAAFFVYNKVELDSKITVEINNVKSISGNIKELFARNPTYDGLRDLVKDKSLNGLRLVYPENMIRHNHIKSSKNYEVVNEFNGDTGVDGSGNYFLIRVHNIPDSACPKLVSALFYDFEDIEINNLEVKRYNRNMHFTIDDHFDMDKITSACAAQNGQPSITFESDLK